MCVKSLLPILLAAPAVAQTGSVAGRIAYAKGPVAAARLKVDKDLPVCGKKPILDETLVVAKDGGLANVVVSIEGVPGAPADPRPLRIDQQGCRYVPHVQAGVVGARLDLVNGDAVLHNVHAYQGDFTPFNLAMPIPGQTIARTLEEPGLMTLKCDAGHTWMSAFVVVKPHRLLAVTAADGTFAIDGVPPGTWKAELWHEKLGTKTVPVTVTAGGRARLDVSW